MTPSDQRCEPTARGIGQRLRYPRLQSGLTEIHFGQRRWTNQQGVERLGRGLHRPILEPVNRVAAALDGETALLIEQKWSA